MTGLKIFRTAAVTFTS